MKTNVGKCLRRKPAIIVLLLVICILAFLNGSRALASTAGTGVTTTDGTNATDTTDTSDTSDTSDSTTASDAADNINGTVGPLQFTLNTGEDGNGLTSTLQMLLVLTVISLAPSILIMVTSFTRIIIVLHFIRSALGLQSTPPNQILIGLSLFLTFFIMSPVINQINTDAVKPLAAGEITQEEAFDAGIAPLRTFMLKQMKEDDKDLRLFMDIANITTVKSTDDIPINVIIPAFIIGELKKAFLIGFLIYIPFVIIDMVVASTLMSMGMMMLPPTMISMPFKILLFIMADGWNLIIGELVKTFY